MRPTTTNYSGRTVDLLLLKTVTEPVTDKVVSPDVSGTPMIVSGIEKLVQRYAHLFLTGAGTVRNSSREGTAFVPELGHGKIYDESTLRAAAVKANKDVVRQIREEDAGIETADDEALADATVTEVAVDRTSATVTVSVKIETLAGETYTYTMPLNMGV